MLYNQSNKKVSSTLTDPPYNTNSNYNAGSKPGSPYPPIGSFWMVTESGEYMITQTGGDRMITE